MPLQKLHGAPKGALIGLLFSLTGLFKDSVLVFRSAEI